MAREKVERSKSIWRQDPSGKWGVHAMKGLHLKPRAGSADDFFKIEDNIDLMTERPEILQNLFATFGGTEFLLRQSIVPVVAFRERRTRS